MRIAYIITRSDAIGGAQVHVLDLAEGMQRLGHYVAVFVGGQGPFTEMLRVRGIECRSLRFLTQPIRPLHDTLAFIEMRQVLRDFQPHLVTTHSSKAGWLGRLAGKVLGIPALFTAHGWAFTDGVPELNRRFYVAAERLAGRWAPVIITVSDRDRDLALRYGVASPSRLVTIHNGVHDVASSLQARPGASPPRIVMVARFEVPKNHRLLLQALAELKDLEWSLDLVGDGPLQAEVRSLASELDLGTRVRFWGARDDVAERLAEAQIFVLSSRWEGFPRSILEAMRAGLPVVASDVGGVREAVVDGETGYLVPRDDPRALADRLGRLLRDPIRRGAMGQAGRLRYQRLFTFERMLENTLRVYDEVLHGSAGRAPDHR